ncbi:hypothetical protein RhiirA5_412327 [Rhizophagus irregularis]|uniref:Uncharacterized protein n=1 Tax=Rhizophagus irregularis TaxID=588596 RepID=A0A2I1ES92_9GLOM|nr:hypothetical protein RhiirA5_412327 [Rhizophagus irregularis]PKC67351.1 hypothetical protein RhiirA1_458562 [Rhizophagus irregularis]PKY24981.1 hypothetical protein RhiirB3_439746 [Rhizophagus irregularis]CAB4474060.1 unnamed protein product [Rhizophagus irregularis]CAB5358234.1 unnamed protein product [Rhizophagus irregularis]
MSKDPNIAAYLIEYVYSKKKVSGNTSSINWRISFTTESYNMPFSSQQVVNGFGQSVDGWLVKLRRTKIHSYYIANSKSELPNFSKDRTAEELRTILNYAHLCDDERIYLEIINVLDLDSMDSMFKDKSNNITDKQLELMNLKEDDFDPDLLVQKFNYN